MKRTGLAIAVMLTAGACYGNPTPPTTLPPPTTTTAVTAIPTTSLALLAENPIRIAGDDFIVAATGEPFVVRGANYFVIVTGPRGRYENRTMSPRDIDPTQVRADFAALTSLGYNTVRIFLECNDNPGCIGSETGPGLNDDYLDAIVKVMDIARDTGMMILFTSNDLPDAGGYRTISGRDDSVVFPGYRNSDFLTASGHEAMVTYWTDLLNGLTERNAAFETVLGWSILNEHWLFGGQPPLSLTSGIVTTAAGDFDMADPAAKRTMVAETTRRMIEQVAGAIRSIHPSALVTMGFFVPQFPNPSGIGGDWYADTAPLVESSDLDFFDFHFYVNSDITVAEAVQNFGVDDRRPVILGEYGVFVADSPSPDDLTFAVLNHMAQACEEGFDGWIYWGYYRAPLDDATWALTDDGGRLLNSISPSAVPDPCVPPPNPNLAAQAAVTASRSLADQPAANAVDGTSRQWGAGADAPQWIEVDLGAVGSVTSIQLTVAQYPAGRTVHRLEWAGADHVFSDNFVFDQSSAEGDMLTFEPPTPIDLRYLRITTTTSPSWVAWQEISVLGERLP